MDKIADVGKFILIMAKYAIFRWKMSITSLNSKVLSQDYFFKFIQFNTIVKHFKVNLGLHENRDPAFSVGAILGNKLNLKKIISLEIA